MKQLSREKRAQIVRSLVEGASLRSTSRMSDVALNSVSKLLKDLGLVCAEYHDVNVRDVRCKRIQADEIWSFNYCKNKMLAYAKAAPEMAGDVWTWTAIC